MKFKRTKCRCSECPLDGNKKVPGESGLDSAAIVIVGDYPDKMEAAAGVPFGGAHGAKLKEAVNTAQLTWHTVFKTNVMLCCPADEADIPEALSCCTPGFLEEIEAIKPKVIIPMEQSILPIFEVEGKLGKVRGSVFPWKKTSVIPTYSPKFINRGMWKEEPTWFNDFGKARSVSLKVWKTLKERFNLFPTADQVVEFVDEVLEKKTLVGVDIETTGFNEFYCKILMIGLAKTGEDVLVVPFIKQGGAQYWKLSDEVKVTKALKRLFKSGRLAFQNALFDVKHLEFHGYKIGSVEEDTMLLHHVISPELPHNLGYIVSVYGSTPFWKDVVLGSADRMIAMDDTLVRTYNARDSAVLLQVLPEMYKHVKEVGTEKTYRTVSLELIRPLLKMTQRGLLIDPKRMQKKKIQFTKDAAKAQERLIQVCSLPEGFNLGSPDLMRLLLWGVKPKSYEKIKKEKEAIDNDPKRKKTTKKYADLEQRIRLIEGTTPLYRPPALAEKRTESGSLATDGDALVSFQMAALRRLEAIEGLVRGKESKREEIARIRQLLEFVEEYSKYSEAEKLATTFGGFPIGPDGRVHPSYKIHGTATGRLSSSDPNIQQVPGEVQDVFTAPPGYVILKADYSNIEYRVMAIMTNEKELEQRFDNGENFHDINTELLFGIDKNHPEWSIYRRAAKTFIFGLSYGGGVNGIYKKILVAVPQMTLTLAGFKKIVDNYFAKLKNYAKWREAITKQARETRCVETAFGRKRFLLGTPDEIERQALNTPIQGTAGEITLKAIIELDKALEKDYPEAHLITTVHDSILIEAPTKQAKPIAKLMKKIMEKDYLIEGRKVHFPVDIEAGPSWGETEPIQV